MINQDSSRVLDSILQDQVPANVNLLPDILAKIGPLQQARTKKLRQRTVAILLAVVALAIGLISLPGVAEAMQRFLWYLPGVGLLERNAPIRVLAEPVQVTRDGVTIGVTQAILTAEKTTLTIWVVGVPRSAYPQGEMVTGCMEAQYLRLPNGSRLDVTGNMPPLPAEINAATLVVPCIWNTLPGSSPVDWELPLRFAPAPPDLTLVPVTEIPPTPSPSMIAGASAAPENPLTLTSVLDIGDYFLLMGEFDYKALGDYAHDNVFADGSWWVEKGIQITDASGKELQQFFNNDIPQPTPSRPDAAVWGIQLDKKFLPPLTITYSGTLTHPAGLPEQAEFTFDAGENPQAGRTWDINKDFILGGYHLRVVSIQSNDNGYTFQFQADPGASANRITMEILGYTPNCGGGGGGEDVTFPQSFTRGICFAEIPGSVPSYPNHKLTVRITFQALSRENKIYRLQWSPEGSQTSPFITPTPKPGVCMRRDMLSQLLPAPAGWSGKALMYGLLPESSTWGLSIAGLDGSHQRELVGQGNWGSLSQDGRRLAYADSYGIRIMDLDTGNITTLKNVDGYDIHWSPDGAQIAYAGCGASISVCVAATDGASHRQISSRSYSAVAGWSPDGKQVYITIMAVGGWMVQAIDAASGTAQNLFLLDDASAKAPYATVSPDGKWLVYRDSQLSALYLVRMDGTDRRKIVESLVAASLVWSPDGKWLGVSAIKPGSSVRTTFILQPETCQVYSLPNLLGDLEGLFIP